MRKRTGSTESAFQGVEIGGENLFQKNTLCRESAQEMLGGAYKDINVVDQKNIPLCLMILWKLVSNEGHDR